MSLSQRAAPPPGDEWYRERERREAFGPSDDARIATGEDGVRRVVRRKQDSLPVEVSTYFAATRFDSDDVAGHRRPDRSAREHSSLRSRHAVVLDLPGRWRSLRIVVESVARFGAGLPTYMRLNQHVGVLPHGDRQLAELIRRKIA